MIRARCIVCGVIKFHDGSRSPVAIDPLGEFIPGPESDPDALVWKADGYAAIACKVHTVAEAQQARVAYGRELCKAKDR